MAVEAVCGIYRLLTWDKSSAIEDVKSRARASSSHVEEQFFSFLKKKFFLKLPHFVNKKDSHSKEHTFCILLLKRSKNHSMADELLAPAGPLDG